MAKLKAVFFDMDGVLYDSMKNHVTTWVESFKKFGVDFPPEEAYMNEGRTGNGTIINSYRKYLNKEATETDIKNVYNEKVRLMAQMPKPVIFPGMQELVKELEASGIQCWVVTGSKQPTLIEKLEHDFGVIPERIISGHDVVKGKPDPEPYLIALKRSGFRKEECMVVENAPLGIQSAKCAGLYTIAVNTGILKDKILIDSGADEIYPDSEKLFGRLIRETSPKVVKDN